MVYLFSLFLFLARGGATLHFKLTSVLRILSLGYGISSVVGASEKCWVYARCFSSLAERSKTANGLNPRSDMQLEKIIVISKIIFDSRMKPSLQKRNPDVKNCEKVHYAVDWCLGICSSLQCNKIQLFKCRLNTRQFAKLRSNKPVQEKQNSLVVIIYIVAITE